MLLNLGLTADAAAAHLDELISSPPDPSTFSLSALPFLGRGILSARGKPSDDRISPASNMAMSPIESVPSEGEQEQSAPPPPLARPRTSHSSAPRKSSTRPKTSYQLAHPAAHARHKRLRIRPKLLLQLQQVSQTPRPLPILDILPSTLYRPLLARKFPAMFRGKNGLGPNDLIIVRSELYEQTMSGIPEKHVSSDDEGEDHRDVVATICQLLQGDARSKGKAEMCLTFGPVWEATPLPSGSYEFVAQTEAGLQVMRWALRGNKNRRVSTPVGSQSREDAKRFTFSVIDPATRRHPVIASMTKNQLEVFDEYPKTVRSSPGLTTPSSGMSVVSDASDMDTPLDQEVITLDNGLRTLIIVTGIWVAFREGWSHSFSYNDPISSPKSLASPTNSKHCPPTTAKTVKTEHDVLPDKEMISSDRESIHVSKRCMSVSNIRRSSTSPAEQSKQNGGLSRRSNSTGAAFMERAKRRAASGLTTRLNRQSMIPDSTEHGHNAVISRSSSLRQDSISSVDPAPRTTRPETGAKINSTAPKPVRTPDAEPPKPHPRRHNERSAESANPDVNGDTAQSKRRNRLSSFFTVFNRKSDR
ncbi:hypothetical protein N7474_006870 [Penicillium riverlandense]|uniref:uncharacterized protein n=1 Tax=Penicillium riverlandense TaxID=1903569 RepID=UPI002546E231|nr:uncharacterized protein N7474_006870 [Penicillium riverlandense]KAJ5815093.1 hypothetical protein N7474_006870 [Penicillium riverlandense]